MLVDEGGADPEVVAFNDGFLWHHGTCYRELHALVSEDYIDKARIYSWQMHSCPYHEKGLWEIDHTSIGLIQSIQDVA